MPIGRCILDRTAETVSVNCQSSNFYQGHVENIPYVPFPSPSRSFFPSSFFPTVFPSKMIFFKPSFTSFQMAKILQLQSSHLVAGKYSISNFFFNLSYSGADLCLPINPCLHGGTCYNALDTYICHCPPRYSGNNCTGV